MFRFIVAVGVSFILSGCSERLFTSNDIERIEYEIDHTDKINHGSTLHLDVYAIDKKGAKLHLNSSKDLDINSPALRELNNSYYVIDAKPNTFDDTKYPITFTYKDTLGTFIQENTLVLDYLAPAHVYAIWENGVNGVDKRKRSSTLFGRDGVDGEKGGAGAHGTPGLNCTIHVWIQGKELRVHVESDSTGFIWKYKSKQTDTLIINIPGGHGGNGGNGGDGGNGKDAKNGKFAGNGGNGGDGGIAGNGGNGGSVLIFVHENARPLIGHIRVNNFGGEAGVPGAGGLGGAKGKSTKSDAAKPTKDGIPGQRGQTGVNGKDGPKPSISVISFDYNQFQ